VERSAVPDGGRAPPDGFPDGQVPEAEALDLRQSDVALRAPNAWDASDGARPDGAASGAHRLLALPADADAGKSAALERGGPAQGARFRPTHRLAQPAPLDAVAALCTPDAVQFGERSCAAQGAETLRVRPESRDAAHSEVQARQAQLKPQWTALPKEAKPRRRPAEAEARDEPAERLPLE